MYNPYNITAWSEYCPHLKEEELEQFKENCKHSRARQIMEMQRTIDNLEKSINELQKELNKPALTNRQTEKALKEGFMKYLEKNPPKII